MKAQDIFLFWKGKRVDYDQAFDFQCVDFVKQFAFAFTGKKLGWFGSGGAFEGWTTGRPFSNSWKRIENGAYSIPTEGSIVFFGPVKGNEFGHVAVADAGCTRDKLIVWEQNAGSGNGDGMDANAITRREKKYSNCLGWYTYIGIWNTERPDDIPTRLEAVTMLSRASGKNTSGMWNGMNGSAKITASELYELEKRSFGKGAVLLLTRKQLADFCHENLK